MSGQFVGTVQTAAGAEDVDLALFDVGGGRRLWNSASARRETEFIRKEIFDERCYEQHGIVVRDGDVVVDAGANIGAFGLSLLERYRKLTLVAVEPSPVTRACLERNIAEASQMSGGDVRVLPCALGSTEGELILTYFPNAPGNSTLRPEDKSAEVDRLINGSTPAQARTLHPLLGLMPKSWVAIALRLNFAPLFSRRIEFTCQVRRFSDVFREQGLERIDLLKVDVEGFELDVLDGIDPADWPKVRQLVMELSPANKGALPGLIDRLRGLGFSRIAVESPGGTEPTPDNPLACLVFALRERRP